MASIWLYVILVPLGLILGGFLTLVIYGFMGMLGDSLIYRRGIPKNRAKASEWIKNNPKKFENTNPEKPTDKDIKGVKENERRKFEKYREFEKLRREELKRRTGTVKNGEFYTPTVEKPRGQANVQTKPTPRVKNDKPITTEYRPRVKLD